MKIKIVKLKFILMLSIALLLSLPKVFAQQADAGRDTTLCAAGSVTLGGGTVNTDYCYSWSPKTGLNDAHVLHPTATPTTTTKYTLTVVGPNFSFKSTDTATVYVVDSVVFKEVATQKYGFDNRTDKNNPHKSVKKGGNDVVTANTYPNNSGKGVFFKSTDEAKATVSPNHAASGAQTLTISGVAAGNSDIQANCGSVEGSTIETVHADVYDVVTKTVAVILVNDSVYSSTNIADSTISNFLRQVYKQAVVEFTVTRLPAKTVAFDLNHDGKVDVTPAAPESFWTNETKVIRDKCKNDAYDYNLFLVDNSDDNSCGMMDFNQRYGFIHPNECAGCSMGTICAHELGHAQGLTHVPNDTAHEGYLMHPYCNHIGDGFLSKAEWDSLH